jgi:hypothetical protein
MLEKEFLGFATFGRGMINIVGIILDPSFRTGTRELFLKLIIEAY